MGVFFNSSAKKIMFLIALAWYPYEVHERALYASEEMIEA